MEPEELGVHPRYLIRDRDSKYTAGFDAVITATGARTIRTPVGSPKANAHLERLLESLRREALDWIIIFDQGHLQRVVAEYFDH